MFRSKYPRDIFNEIKWRFDISKCRIFHIHRGAPGNVKVVDGSMIKSIDTSFLVLQGILEDVYIPYHRITRIEYDNQIIFDRTLRSLPQKAKKMKKINFNYFFLGTGFGFSLGFFFALLDMSLFAS